MKLREAFFRELPGERQLFDFGIRTDGQPVYFGHAPLGTVITSPDWVLTFFKYNEDGTMTEAYCLKGAWNSRVALFMDYA